MIKYCLSLLFSLMVFWYVDMSYACKIEEIDRAVKEIKEKDNILFYINYDFKSLEREIRYTLEWLEEPEAKKYARLLTIISLIESNLGIRTKQKGGKALSIFQVEPITHKDIHDIFLKRNPKFRAKLESITYPNIQGLDNLESNRIYSICIAYFLLLWRTEPNEIPQYEDIEGQINLHKRVYNTHKGKSTTYDSLYKILGVI